MLSTKNGQVWPSSCASKLDYDRSLPGHKRLDLSKLLTVNQREFICLQMQGDAMQNLGIWRGDILIINRKSKQFSGKIVVVKIKKRLLVRRLFKTGDEILLMPANENYEPIKLIAPIENILWGIVDCVIRRV